MGIIEDLNAWWIQLQDYEESNSAKAKFQDIMSSIDRMLTELEDMYNAGDFSKLPVSVQTEFVWAWGQLDAVRQACLARTAFMQALEWTP